MTTPKQSPKPADDVAAMVERLNQKARGERNSVGDHWGDHICAEAAALLTNQAERIKELEAERDGYRDRAHYAEGTASLAIQHRDAAEKRIADLEAERDEMEEHARNNGREGWKQYERAEAAEKRNAELEARLGEAVKVLEPFALAGNEYVTPKERVGHIYAARAFLATIKEHGQ